MQACTLNLVYSVTFSINFLTARASSLTGVTTMAWTYLQFSLILPNIPIVYAAVFPEPA